MPIHNTDSSAQYCPHCGQANNCAVATGNDASSCWCMSASFNRERVQQYQAEARCLCPQCGCVISPVAAQPPATGQKKD